MIRISLLGLDRYIVGAYAKESTARIAKIYGVKEEEVIFYAPESFLFHKGVEQGSYQVFVEVHAPRECKNIQKEIAKFLLDSIAKFVIHVALRFEYFEAADFYEHVNNAYMRFLDEEIEEADDADVLEEGVEDEELFIGDAFAGFEEKHQETHDHNTGGCTCNHGENCDCGDGGDNGCDCDEHEGDQGCGCHRR